MFDITSYLEKLEAIRQRDFLSGAQLARELNVSYHCLKSVVNKERPVTAKTAQKIKKYVEMKEGK